MPAWITPSSSTLSLVLRDAGDKPPLVADIHPTRWKPRVSMEHAVLTLLADFAPLSATYGHTPDTWLEPLRTSWMGRPYAHPDVLVEEGGLDIHRGTPLPQAVSVHLAADTITLPDGRVFDAAAFAAGFAYVPNDASVASRQLYKMSGAGRVEPADPLAPSTARTEHALLGVSIGAVQALDGRPYDVWRDLRDIQEAVALVGAAAARVLTACPKTGKEAYATGRSLASSAALYLANTWALRPDRAWMPGFWTTSAVLDPFVAQVDGHDIKAGRAAMEAVLAYISTGRQVPMLRYQVSAHDTLARRALSNAIDSALLATWASDPARLKPASARRAAKIAA